MTKIISHQGGYPWHGKKGKIRHTKVVVNGVKFDSKLEAQHHAELEALQRSGIISGLRRQMVYETIVNGVLVCRYKSDHEFVDTKGRFRIIDTKGHDTAYDRLRRKITQAYHGIKIELWTKKKGIEI